LNSFERRLVGALALALAVFAARDVRAQGGTAPPVGVFQKHDVPRVSPQPDPGPAIGLKVNAPHGRPLRGQGSMPATWGGPAYPPASAAAGTAAGAAPLSVRPFAPAAPPAAPMKALAPRRARSVCP